MLQRGSKEEISLLDGLDQIKRRTRSKWGKSNHKNWTCGNCKAEFSRRRYLLEHRRLIHPTHKNNQDTYMYLNEVYRCKSCSMTATAQQEMERHVLSHVHAFDCADCSQSFNSAYKYACHMRTHSKDNKLNCPLCDMNTTKLSTLQHHINGVHLNKFLYYCKHCGKGFNDKGFFKEHEDFHAFGTVFACVVCEMQFSYSRYLLHHQIRTHTVAITGMLAKNQCEMCKRIFAKEVSLQNHMLCRHASNKIHLCDNCGKRFSTRSKLNIHYRIHTGFKPYMCNYCEKSFLKKDCLVLHVRTHTGEKPYSCEYCSKSFSQLSTLKTHVRSHTGEKPYVCRMCSAAFSVKTSLTAHYRACTG